MPDPTITNLDPNQDQIWLPAGHQPSGRWISDALLINSSQMNLFDALNSLTTAISDVCDHANSDTCLESMLNARLSASGQLLHAQGTLNAFEAWKAAGEALGDELHNLTLDLCSMHEDNCRACSWCLDLDTALTEAHYDYLLATGSSE